MGEALEGCNNLSVLDVRGNKLTEIPSEVGALTKLKHADFRDNTVAVVPASMCNVPATAVVLLDGNPLATEYAAALAVGRTALMALLKEREAAETAERKRAANSPEGIVSGLLYSIGRPGINPGVVKAGYLIYGLMFIVCLIQLALFVTFFPRFALLYPETEEQRIV